MVSMLLNTIDDAKQNARGFFYRFNDQANRRALLLRASG
jgi:hypothetical protein